MINLAELYVLSMLTYSFLLNMDLVERIYKQHKFKHSITLTTAGVTISVLFAPVMLISIIVMGIIITVKKVFKW